MSTKTQKSYSREEELLLHDFSRNVSAKSSALFYGNALVVSLTVIWPFLRIHQMDLYSSAFVCAIVTVLATWLIAYAYKNVKYVMKFQIASKRGEAIAREVSKQIADGKKMTKKEKDERVLWKQNEVADYEATTYSIFYNNAIFIASVIVLFYLLSSFSTTINYLFSVSLSAALCALLSNSKK